MSLSDLASLGSFVSGAAVLVSLIFLYFQLQQVSQQVRQAEKIQQAMMRQSRSARSFEMCLKSAEPAIAEALLSIGRGGETETLLFQWASYARGSFINWDDAFAQYKDGLLSASALDSMARAVGQVMRNVALRTEWRLQRQSFAPEFVAWIDGLVADYPKLEPGLSVAVWRSAFAAEQSGVAH